MAQPTKQIVYPRKINETNIANANRLQQNILQKKRLEEELTRAKEERKRLDEAKLKNNPIKGQMKSRPKARQIQSSLKGNYAKIKFLELAIKNLQKNTYYEKFDKVLEMKNTAYLQAKSDEQTRLKYTDQRIKVNRQRREIEKELAKYGDYIPKYIDELGQGVSVAPELVKQKELNTSVASSISKPEIIKGEIKRQNVFKRGTNILDGGSIRNLYIGNTPNQVVRKAFSQKTGIKEIDAIRELAEKNTDWGALEQHGIAGVFGLRPKDGKKWSDEEALTDKKIKDYSTYTPLGGAYALSKELDKQNEYIYYPIKKDNYYYEIGGKGEIYTDINKKEKVKGFTEKDITPIKVSERKYKDDEIEKNIWKIPETYDTAKHGIQLATLRYLPSKPFTIGATYGVMDQATEDLHRGNVGKNPDIEYKIEDYIARGAISGGTGYVLGLGTKMIPNLGKVLSDKMIARIATTNMKGQTNLALANLAGITTKTVGNVGGKSIRFYFGYTTGGEVYELGREIYEGNSNNTYMKLTELGSSLVGFGLGDKTGNFLTKKALQIAGKYEPTNPEMYKGETRRKVIPQAQMAKQITEGGDFLISRRGAYQTEKGFQPRTDVWSAEKTKYPTEGSFWRYDKLPSGQKDMISPLPEFTKTTGGYRKMFKSNWERYKDLPFMTRLKKTLADTPVMDDVLVRKRINLEPMKDKKLAEDMIYEYSTTGGLSKGTQKRLLDYKESYISDKNREWFNHLENELMIRTPIKLKRSTAGERIKDPFGIKNPKLSWTFDSKGNLVPVMEGGVGGTVPARQYRNIFKNELEAGADAQYISDNYALQTMFKNKMVQPKGHAYEHMKNVENNMWKVFQDTMPKYKKYWEKIYGNTDKAWKELRKAMWHDLAKYGESSKEFGIGHGQALSRAIRLKSELLPNEIGSIVPQVRKAIRTHETLDPRKISYFIMNKFGKISPEQKILSTADRMDLARYNIKIDPKRMPIKEKKTKVKTKTPEKEVYKSFITSGSIGVAEKGTEIPKVHSPIYQPKMKTETIKIGDKLYELRTPTEYPYLYSGLSQIYPMTYTNKPEKYKNDYYETPYQKPYDDYIKYDPYDGYTSYTPYNPYGGYGSYEEYSPYEPYTGYTPYPIRPKEYPKKPMPYPRNIKQKLMAWRPLFYDDYGNKIIGSWFKSIKEAENEGLIGTSQSPATKFELEKGYVERGEVKQGRKASLIKGKFQKRGRLYIEKQQFRKDTIPERAYEANRNIGKGKGMNIMPYVFG